MKQLSGKTAIVGAYESPRRDAPRVHPFALQMECIVGALDDAGLTLTDVDGLCAASGDWAEGGGTMDVIELAEYIGIQPTYVNSTDVGGCSYILQAGQAAAAIATGLAEVVVISYAACPRWWPLSTPSFDPFVFPAGPGQYEIPYAPTLISTYGMFARRHMDLYGTTPEQLAQVAVTFRGHAAANPQARLRKPITVDDVLASPTIASPLHRLDCCVVTDGGGALVMTSRERARDLKRRPVYLAGYGAAVARTQNSQIPDDLATPAALSGPRAFAMAGMSPAEIDVAQIYDAFTITPMLALEDLGFCGRGESGPFVASGNLAADGGSLPTNTDGGGLSSNHPGKRGIFTLIESVRQLRGDAPGIQVPDAKVALAHGLGGTFCSAATAILAV